MSIFDETLVVNPKPTRRKAQPTFVHCFNRSQGWQPISREQTVAVLRKARAARSLVCLRQRGVYRVIGNFEWVTIRTKSA
jgi:hypothetical protein